MKRANVSENNVTNRAKAFRLGQGPAAEGESFATNKRAKNQTSYITSKDKRPRTGAKVA